MCGLVGIFSPYKHSHEKAFHDLLRVDVMRGPDSTGAAIVDSNGDVTVVKKALLPDDLFGTKAWTKAVAFQNQCYMGHNRWATIGKVNGANAHPFEFDGVVGMHNGTLKSRWALQDKDLFDTDSENLYWHMNENGVADTWSKLDGAAALVWWDNEDGTLNFLRNDDRPFCYAKLDTGGVVWASEPWMITGIMSRHDIKIGKVYVSTVNKHYVMSIEEIEVEVIDKDGKVTTRKVDEFNMGGKMLTPYVPPKTVVQYTGFPKKKTSVPSSTPISTDSTTIDMPVSGNSYSVYPKGTTCTEYPGAPTRWTIECGFQNYDKELTANLFLHDIHRHGELLHMVPDSQGPYDKVFFKTVVKNQWFSNDMKPHFVLDADQTTIILPQDSKIYVLGDWLTQNEFNMRFKECGWCGDPLLFDDSDITFGEGSYAACGSCTNLGNLHDDSNLLELKAIGETA